jgi:hypothetical protein
VNIDYFVYNIQKVIYKSVVENLQKLILNNTLFELTTISVISKSILMLYSDMIDNIGYINCAKFHLN